MELKKVVFLGIENAGKSTILNVLSEKYSLISNQAPTLKIERQKMENIFGYDIINWDFPGQKSLREKYLNQIEQTLSNTDLMIYIVDIQDYRHISSSISFFRNIIHKFESIKMTKIPLFVFCHKCDPDILEDEPIEVNLKEIKEKFSAIAKSYPLKFFNTTIYDRWTIFFAFSKAFQELLPETDEAKIRECLASFAAINNFKSVLLMDNNNLIINEYSNDAFSSDIINSLALILNTIYDVAVQKKLGKNIKIELLSGVVLLIPIQLKKNSIFFLLGYLDSIEPDFQVKRIDQTVEELKVLQKVIDVD